MSSGDTYCQSIHDQNKVGANIAPHPLAPSFQGEGEIQLAVTNSHKSPYFSIFKSPNLPIIQSPNLLPSYRPTVLRSYRLTLLFSLLLLLLPAIAPAQTADDILTKFFVVQQGDEMLMRWTIRQGNTCEDTYVERSLDGIHFQRIGLISGVCGSPDQSITYEFYDTLPAPNRINYYRLELGLYGYTSLQSAEFILLNDLGYSLQPNPMREKAAIIFENPGEEKFRFVLVDMNGQKVMDFTITGDRITLYREELGSGVYVFTLDGSSRIVRGKLLVN